MIAVKHIKEGRLVLALCDDDILGKIFEEGKKILDLSSKFYKGEKHSEEEILKYLKESYVVNAAGEKTILFLIKNNLVEKESVKKINNIPYAQVIFEDRA